MIKGNSIFLRAVEPKDADLLYKWENNMQLWKVSNTLKPFSYNIIKKYIENEHLDIFQIKQLRLMISLLKEQKTTVGMIDMFDFDPYHKRAGVGIMINSNFRKKGYALDAIFTFSDYAFDFLNIHQLYCSISMKNKKSINLFTKAGFEKAGIHKHWLFNGKNFDDVCFLQKINY